MKGVYLTEGDLGMAVKLAGSSMSSTVPQEERMHG